MYSNIPIELALNSVLSRWNLIEKNTSIPIQEFKRAISIILNSTFFKFNDEIYEQIFGIASITDFGGLGDSGLGK